MEEYTNRQNDEANKIINTINDMVEDEERKRWEGGEFQNRKYLLLVVEHMIYAF